MLTAAFYRYIESQLTGTLRQKIHLQRMTPVAGGSINSACRIDSNAGSFFLKVNDASRFPLMFEKEKAGLQTIASTKTISVPEVLMTGEYNGQSFLLMRFISSGGMKKDFWELFARQLAAMHKTSANSFGHDEDNYIGSMPQSNRRHKGWADFFTTERIMLMAKMAMDAGKLSSNDVKYITILCDQVGEWMPKEPPSLLHGDLWNGNFLIDEKGDPLLIDPAVYFGHREMDLAMTKLFGGFDDAFYAEYNNEFGIEPGFEKRYDLCNLYPLLVHVNLFGGEYAAQVRSIVKSYLKN